MKEQFNFGNYAEDCIHLHACRLLAKRYRDAGCKHVARFCNEDCPAYDDAYVGDEASEIHTWVTASDAARMARSLAYMIRSGYDEFDTFCTSDFCECDTATTGFIVEVDDD